MKILNTMLGRQAIAAALVLSLAIPMSVGAFAEEPAAAAATDDTVVAGYLPPQDESVMLQGEIALHSGDVAVGETDPAYGGYRGHLPSWTKRENVMSIATNSLCM